MPGANSAELRARAIRQKLQMRAAHALTTASTTGTWVSLGPKPLPSDASGSGLQDYRFVSGRATAIAIDPNDSSGNTVYAGGAYAGVWKSTNAAALSQDPASVTWTPLTDRQATLAVGAIAVQPQLSNPDPTKSVVLVGTGETDSSADSYYGLGILRSADGGQTWALIPQDAIGTHSFAGLGFSQIAFSTGDPSLVVAAAASASEGILEGLENPVATSRGLYYSRDAGINWQAASVTESGVGITPASVTSVLYNAPASTFYAAIRFHGFYSSRDGANWVRLATQPGSGLNADVCPARAISSSNCPLYRGEIAAVPHRPGTSGLGEMYAWYVDANDADQGIWQSLDGGASWTQIDDSGITNCGDFFGGCGTSQGIFDLTLAAVPNSLGTDLYAGSVNIYKCAITNAFPACNGTGNNTFLNLTHAYGCSDVAKVHPNQHAMDFLVANGTSLLYFANDGGIYRALDAYTALTTGTCGLTNQFDSLNQSLGPMTQFVSVSQSSSNANLIFGGTQDNGAPATTFSQPAGTWVNVNAGDNGFTAINPKNEDEWFVATPPDAISGVNLFRCANGVNCHSLDFQNDQVADSNALGGDTGAFYLPFLLDPQESSELILGTCRIWRGVSTGGNFSLLSPDFETGGTDACSGNEINLVRSLAAGGLKDSNGFSQVIYAGTSGDGPLIQTTPTGGHVWVTANADGGPLSWNDVTESINPQGFPISSIALDSADPQGNTAYVTVMGFHTSHVWKTTNAGASWTDFTANLPDAPANAAIVDSGASFSNGTVYVGTDVGVFASSTSVAAWSEVGGTPSENGIRFLPNVAVTSLQIFNSGGLKRLRAATYGRGIWEWNLITTPDFQLNVSNNPLTIFATQTSTFNGTISALNGYNSNVNVRCTSGATGPPQNCTPIPASILPTTAGASFAINAGGSAGDYTFNLHAVGTDSATVTHDFALTLHIVDFTLSAPSPAAISVAPGNTSASASLLVSALGSFSGSVTLSCSNLPTGASCQFQPSPIVSPTNGNPVSVNLNIVTALSTPLGTFPITITATTLGAPAKTQTLTLITGTTADYTLNIANPYLTASLNSAAQFNGTLTSLNGYSNPVTLSCGPGAPPTCTVNPAIAAPSSAGTSFAVTVSSNISQDYPFNINGVGSDPAATTHSAAVTFTALPNQNFDFTISITPASASVPVGQPTIFTVNVNPTTGSFPGNVTFACSKLPALTTCGFNPTQVGAGSENSDVTFTLATTAPVPASRTSILATFVSAFPIAGLMWVKRRTSSRQVRQTILGTVLLLLSLGLLSCGGGLQGNGGGGGTLGTPRGTYTITVTASCGSVTHNAQVSLTVTQ